MYTYMICNNRRWQNMLKDERYLANVSVANCKRRVTIVSNPSGESILFKAGNQKGNQLKEK